MGGWIRVDGWMGGWVDGWVVEDEISERFH